MQTGVYPDGGLPRRGFTQTAGAAAHIGFEHLMKVVIRKLDDNIDGTKQYLIDDVWYLTHIFKPEASSED